MTARIRRTGINHILNECQASRDHLRYINWKKLCYVNSGTPEATGFDEAQALTLTQVGAFSFPMSSDYATIGLIPTPTVEPAMAKQPATTKPKPKAKPAPRKKAAPKAVASTKAEPVRTVTLKNQRFVDEYLVDLNATQAAIRAGYSPATAYSIGHELLRKPEIASEITKRQADRLQRIEIDQDKIVRELLSIAHADANELVEYRRTCCRFCWGEGFQYQRTANEMESDRDEYDREVEKNNALPADLRKNLRPFNERGGIGYDMRKEPHDDCAECFGQGVGNTFVKDTRYLSPAARALYAGVKQTKDGLEIKMHDKHGFIQLLMRHAGMLNDKIKLQGDGDNPLNLLLQQVMGTGLPVMKDDE